MIKFYKIFNEKDIKEIGEFQENCWINVVDPDESEKSWLIEKFEIDGENISDILDIDEQSRYEKDENYTLFIMRGPAFDKNRDVSYFTVPIGVIFHEKCLITICLQDNIVIRNVLFSKMKNIRITTKNIFLLTLFLRSSINFLIFLKALNKETSLIEKDLKKSIKNTELYDLLTIEKSLVFFTTALRSNELLLEKIQKGVVLKLYEDEIEALEDAMTENKQAIEMANIHSNILSGMMDAFASIISNNLNVVVKKLTAISLVLMIPTLIASIYGMNVGLPFQHSVYAFLIVILGSVLLSAGALIFFVLKKFL
ncbi:magnesium transporter CorA family protein [candidate division WOR-3 bacterium]|nr:magnesium transporter CorA family protein [candidate division WOR-3 bacterium]